MKVKVIGAGLAGSEAAWQLAKRGIEVELTEMKPKKRTPAHVANGYAELVCSNSFRGDELSNAVGLLKEEMRRIGSLIMECADKHKVPAGGALGSDGRLRELVPGPFAAAESPDRLAAALSQKYEKREIR